jgi:hypothetical protein
MSIKCSICQTESPDSAQYCEGCGIELTAASAASVPPVPPAPVPDETAPQPAPALPPVPEPSQPAPAPAPAPAARAAKLLVKKYGAYTGDEVPLLGTRMVVGRFDASSGPVDVDVTGLPGAEHVSRHHAEIFVENDEWKVRDLGSTNGVFIRRNGESGFSPRLQEPAVLKDGDELALGNVMLLFREA